MKLKSKRIKQKQIIALTRNKDQRSNDEHPDWTLAKQPEYSFFD